MLTHVRDLPNSEPLVGRAVSPYAVDTVRKPTLVTVLLLARISAWPAQSLRVWRAPPQHPPAHKRPASGPSSSIATGTVGSVSSRSSTHCTLTANFRTSLTHRPQAPEIVALYAIPVTAQQFRHAIRRKFEENRYVSDQRVIDVLLLKGRQEYQETMNLWKQTDHVMGILLEERKRPQRTFLQKFYEGACILGTRVRGVLMLLVVGRDEDAVLPAATGLLK